MNFASRSLVPFAAAVWALAVAPASAQNVVADASFEKPVVGQGSFTLIQKGQRFNHWVVVGADGNVAPISGSFQQDGFQFPAKRGAQWIDLTGVSNSATGVEQTVDTMPGLQYELVFYVGNVSGGIFGTTSSIQVFLNGDPLMLAVNSSGTTTQVWKRFATTITAVRPRTKIRFINGDAGSDNHCGLDAVSLSPVDPG